MSSSDATSSLLLSPNTDSLIAHSIPKLQIQLQITKLVLNLLTDSSLSQEIWAHIDVNNSSILLKCFYAFLFEDVNCLSKNDSLSWGAEKS